ncbi:MULTISPECIES: hypothetical protein [Thiorhodovibrio]|uniref:hypothetical protein n=1 Tax=Thiorhodovibrio TaxID=61593 RepID=UPI001912C6B8|nr:MULTISPECIES: hypothetical protein [Thiorhodovibrio]MBK5970848.1 hypothetical protein [Thiorhodovibrio winogradskyi]WPL10760.1 hypothetical protein Thiosp_00478 [Thiorhodovibrio litoralis]
MTTSSHQDPFAQLFPSGIERMPTAWQHLRIPAAPAAFRLRADETAGPPEQRFGRRTILTWDCRSAAVKASEHDRLALIDKALPHALHDVMLSEVSASPKPAPESVLPITGRLLWRSALEFVRFVSQPGTQRTFGLDGGHLSLAMNCDPCTSDRESVQAAKQFHLHLLYWSDAELKAIAAQQPLAATRDLKERRQLLDPLSFLGGALFTAALQDLDLAPIGARLLDTDAEAIIRGERPPGCLIELPGWNVLGEPAFEAIMRAIHQRIAHLSAQLSQAFVGHNEPPPPWHRHRLLPAAERLAAVHALSLPAELEASLKFLGEGLRDLSPATAARLQHASPRTRQHCMSLNQPCYGVNLYTPLANTLKAPVIASRPVYLLLSAKLFSGIGCAGLLPIGATPSVRVLRGEGEFSPQDWHARAAWQHAFATHLRKRLTALASVHIEQPKQLRDFASGWC